LRIATWNLENLHAVNGESTFTGSDPSTKRFPIDYERIRCYVRLFDPDILAVQEVDGEEALKRVVDTDVYDVVVSKRPKPPGMNGKQNTGFAFKKGLHVQPHDDFADLDVSNGALRRGTRIDLIHGGQTFLLMSVHLKSGCFDNGSSGSACNTLFNQIPVLERWIDEAASSPNPFIVLGDFNRRLNQPEDLVWTNIDDAQPPNADLTTITENMPISCRDNKFPEFIDHIVFDKRAIAFVDRSSFRQITYRQADKEVWDAISDHCPVVVEMWVK
jgi:endonuclease/exonuclease/phosphatase family metal-dependent hydrolase